MKSALIICLAGPLAACGEGKCPPLPERPLPMTAARAQEIAPAVQTGLALSVTQRVGLCTRIDTADERGCDNSDCTDQRIVAEVFVLGPNVSVAGEPQCDGEVSVAQLKRLGAEQGTSDAQGEWVTPALPGVRLLFVSIDGRCAQCPENEAGRGCRFDVEQGAVQARNLVLRRTF